MLVRVLLQQRAQANQPNQSNQANSRPADRADRAERPERPERPEQPERPERPESPDVAPRVNQIIVRDGVPVVPAIPGIPSIDVFTGASPSPIPPQVVDLSYGFFAMVAAILIGRPLSRAFGRRIERGGQPAISSVVGDQLQRIEHAVDAMALEVERISEAQRYITKLNAGRAAEPGVLPSGERR